MKWACLRFVCSCRLLCTLEERMTEMFLHFFCCLFRSALVFFGTVEMLPLWTPSSISPRSSITAHHCLNYSSWHIPLSLSLTLSFLSHFSIRRATVQICYLYSVYLSCFSSSFQLEDLVVFQDFKTLSISSCPFFVVHSITSYHVSSQSREQQLVKDHQCLSLYSLAHFFCL